MPGYFESWRRIRRHSAQGTTTAGAGQPFPILLTASFFDGPSDVFSLTRTNTLTRAVNFLREVQLEFHFCTVLSLCSPANVYQHLKHIYWNVHWQAQFQPTNFANITAPWTITPTGGQSGNMANVSHVHDGGTSDRKFSGLITAATAPNCNQVATNEANNANVRESRRWENFLVTR
ncbi:MAG TPA: hypothetical protein VKZ53_25910 [Candidatus Angelobacter sp.]|nr:hypothetical protein [Candidatus Angelobacter sp.]